MTMFHEDWYSNQQIAMLIQKAFETTPVPGVCIEVGCWEGKSTIAIAKAVYPKTLHAIDTWKGSFDESPNHDTVKIAQERNVKEVFRNNLKGASIENVSIWVMDWRHFFSECSYAFITQGIAFLHIDGSHDYHSVKDNILSALPHMSKGGVICGDDIQTAHKGRADLHGGVEQALIDVFGNEYSSSENFWWWKKQ